MEASTSTHELTTQRRDWLPAAMTVLAVCVAAAVALAAYALAVASGSARAVATPPRTPLVQLRPLVQLEPSTSLPGAGLERLNSYGRALTAGATRASRGC